MEDAGIIELFFERSEQGIRELDIKYGKACRKLSYNIVNDRQDAEECVNDAYLGAWNAIPPVKPDPLLTYICKIVRNISLNLYICFFSCSNYVKDYRGSCPTRHYVRADAIEQVVKLELQRMAQFLWDDEPMFADLLERKSNREIAEEKKRLEGELQKARMRTETMSRLYKKAFEKNAEGLLSDEGFLQITHEYDVEQLALKAKIPQLREQIAEAERQAANKDKFIAAIRKFMQMDELTAPLLRELIDHIEVYETQGVGKSRTQRITMHHSE